MRLDTHGGARRLLGLVVMALAVLALLPSGNAFVAPRACINPLAEAHSWQRVAATAMTPMFPTAQGVDFGGCGCGGGGPVANMNVYGGTRAPPAVHGVPVAAAGWFGRSNYARLGQQGQSDNPAAITAMDVSRRRLRSVGMTAAGAPPSPGGSGRFGPSSWASMRAAQTCAHLLGPEAPKVRQDAKKSGAKTDSSGGGGDRGGGRGGGREGRNRGGGGGGGDGRQRGRHDPSGDSGVPAVGANRTDVGWSLGDRSLTLESGVDIDEKLVSRSPLVRTLAPVFRFFRSRAGLYGMMLGYVAFTLSQHITPVYVGMSFLTAIGPGPARRLLVLGTQTLSVLTVVSYVQDQFRHQVYPLPAVASGPSAPYAVITGGSSGIGREIANELAGRGYNIMLVARGKEELKRAAKELAEASREAAEAAKREQEEGRQDSVAPESRRERRRRLRRERKERMRRSASSSRGSRLSQDAQGGKKSAAPGSSSSSSSHPPADESSENHRDRDGDREDDERGRHGWGAGEEPVAPHLAKAITARWFAADLGNSTAAAAVYDEVQRLNLTVEILVNAAGMCRRCRVENCADQDLSAQLLLNVVGTSRLTRLFAQDFVARRRGRIMMVSSVVSAAPNPTVAAYAASKSYLTSFAEALHSELEVSGVGVTCVMPGATRTSFQDNSGSAGALVWQLPLFSMEADEVAARSVEALMRGDRTVVPGWQNKLYVHLLAPLLPRKILMSFSEAMWR
eukprot:g9672.t1